MSSVLSYVPEFSSIEFDSLTVMIYFFKLIVFLVNVNQFILSLA